MTGHRPFVPWPDPRLNATATPVGEITEEIRAIWDEMIRAMVAMPGVGLAAPQLGIDLRLAVVDCSDAKDQTVRLANPVIVRASEKLASFTEASPNLPSVSAELARPAEVDIRYLDEHGDETVRSFDGLWATSVQHQIDHLDGKLFIDRLSPMKRRRLLEQRRKTMRRAERGRD